MKFTPEFLRLATDTLEGHSNPLYQKLRERFEEHAVEEEGHEQWVLGDLANIGQLPSIVETVPPCDEIVVYNAYSRFVVKSPTSVGILGEAFMLEGISERYGTPMAQSLSRNSDIPNIRNAVTFLEGHGDADQGHMAELRRVLEAITDQRDLEAIVLCGKVVSQLYTAMIDRLAA